MAVSRWQKEQLQSLAMARDLMARVDADQANELFEAAAPYLAFRNQLEDFLLESFGEVCTAKCYTSNLSACCQKEGILVFFADTVLNCLVSSPESLDVLNELLNQPNPGNKCVFLGKSGCLWALRPVVCAMFLCDQAQNRVFEQAPSLARQWEDLKRQKNSFTWPDQPVLFDFVEHWFIQAGYRSPTMYLHQSPGLVRIKAKATPTGRFY